MAKPKQTLSRRDFMKSSSSLVAGGMMSSSLLGCQVTANKSMGSKKTSIPGTYQGYSSPVADGFIRTSNYVNSFDGTKIAVDTFRPTLNGHLLNKALPLVAICTGYRRSSILSEHDTDIVKKKWSNHKPGDMISHAIKAAKLPDLKTGVWPEETKGFSLDKLAKWLEVKGSVCEYLLVHGYNISVIDTRGSGASFGLETEQNLSNIGGDLHKVFEWYAEQSWCSEQIGMVGASWHGAVQHMAMTYGTNYVKALIPQVTSMDQYLGLWPGGIFNLGLMKDWLELMTKNPEIPSLTALAVDDDVDSALLEQAMRERANAKADSAKDSVTVEQKVEATLASMTPLTRDYFQYSQGLIDQPFADGSRGDLMQSPLDFERANASQIPVYSCGGWWDIYAKETPLIHANLQTPKKLIMGPWNHGNYWFNSEAHRWFDYWLKDIQNGIMEEPPITLAISTADSEPTWLHGLNFPSKNTKYTTFMLTEEEQLIPASSNNSEVSSLSFTTDYTTSSGPGARAWGFSLGALLDYSHLNAIDEGSLSFASSPMDSEMIISGYPALDVSLSSSVDDAKLFAYLICVTESGDEYCLAESWLDLKFSPSSGAPYNTLGTQWYDFASTSIRPVVPGQEISGRLDFTPISWRLRKGDYIKLLLTGADKHNAHQIEKDSPPTLTFNLNKTRLTLPQMAGNVQSISINDAFKHSPSHAKAAIKPA